MSKPQGPWRPRVGDHVYVRGKTLTNTVHRINGDGNDCRYILPDAAPDRTAYWIDEIEPVD